MDLSEQDQHQPTVSRKRKFNRYRYKTCPHCNRELNPKKFREHERLFYNYDSKEWCKEKGSSDESSEISSFEDSNEVEHAQSETDQSEFEDYFADENTPGLVETESHPTLQKLNPTNTEGCSVISPILLSFSSRNFLASYLCTTSLSLWSVLPRSLDSSINSSAIIYTLLCF